MKQADISTKKVPVVPCSALLCGPSVLERDEQDEIGREVDEGGIETLAEGLPEQLGNVLGFRVVPARPEAIKPSPIYSRPEQGNLLVGRQFASCPV